MSIYRLKKSDLFNELAAWHLNSFLTKLIKEGIING